MKRFRYCLGAGLAGLLLLSQSIHAALLSDLWWKPDESGWGANVVHQDDTAFVTLYVYAPSGEPTWYFSVATQVGLLSNGLPVLAGELYRARGPWLGGAFDPGQVERTRVGALSITPTDRSHARIDYDADGVSVSKSVERIALRVPASEPAALGYSAALALTLRVPDRLPRKSISSGTADVRIANDTVEVVIRDGADSCTHRGPLVQEGKYSTMKGTYLCDSGRFGSVEIDEMEFTRNGFVARIAMTTPEGVQSGTLAGAAR